MKRSFNRVLSFILTLLMLVSMVPVFALPATAATDTDLSSLSVSGLSVAVTQNATSEGTAEWTSVGANSIKASLVGKYSTSKVFFMTFYTYAASSTALTFTSSLSSEAVFQFDYKTTLTNGTIKIGDTPLTDSGTYEGSIPAGGTVTLTLSVTKREQTSNSPNNASIEITNIRFFVDSKTQVTFDPAEVGGSYTVDGSAVTSSSLKEVTASQKVTLAATPAEGYSFAGWYSEEKGYLSADLNWVTNFAEDQTVTAKFIPTANGIFGVGDARFDDLTVASTCAASSSTKIVVLLKDATITGNHTVALGSTLLIPYEETNKCPTTEPVSSVIGNSTSRANPKVYRTLTLASGASITVYGELSVAAEHIGGQAGSVNIYGGAVKDTYGCIQLNSGSTLTIGKAATLYAWGYILGTGKVNVLQGATVYEKMQITDYRGGSNTLSIATTTDGIFPFNQYYVQNIEAPITLNYGALLKAHAALVVSGTDVFASSIDFIGGETAMFQIGEGATITKRYDGNTDRLIFDAEGNIALKSLVLSINGIPLVGSMVVNSADYVLPINGNITINVNSGMTTVMQDVLLQPGTQVNVDSDAMLVLGDPNTGAAYDVYIMDSENWGQFAFLNKTHEPVYFAPSRNGNPRKTAALTDATVNINGTLLNMGALYTSSNGASIVSSEGTGLIFMMANAPAATTVGQYTKDKTKFDINVTPAQLKNGNTVTPFTATAGAATMDVFVYDTLRDMWMKPVADLTLTYDANGGSNAPSAQTVTLDGLKGMSESHIITLSSDVPTYENAEFKGWAFTTDGDVVVNPGDNVVIGENTTLYAVWEETECQHDWGNPTYTWTDDFKKCTAERVCSKNGDHKETETVTATGEVTAPPSCTAKGTTTYTAVFAAEWAATQTKSVQDVEFADHSFTSKKGTIKTPGTCMEEAVYAVKCDNCDAESTTLTVKGDKDPSNHTEKNITIKDNSEPSCGNTGYTGDKYCECGTKIEEGTIIPATGNHSFNNKVSDQQASAADCENAATYYVQCDNCDAVSTDKTVAVGSATGHDYQLSGYTDNGNGTHTANYVCENNASHTKSDAPVPHTYTDGKCVCKAVQTFTVTWINENGDIVDSEIVEYGKNATKNPAVPVKEGFDGAWEKVATNVTSNVIIKPTYSTSSINITWIVEGVSSDSQYDYGAVPNFGSIPTKDETEKHTYTFAGWMTSDGTKYPVGTALPVAKTPVTYTAYFTENARLYKITWYNEDGTTVLYSGDVAYNTVPVYGGATLTKEPSATTVYVHAGWSSSKGGNLLDSIPAVTGDAAYYAFFTESARTYEITWKDSDGNVLYSEDVTYGTTPSYKGEPLVKQCHILSWNPEIDEVTGDATYTAVWTANHSWTAADCDTPKTCSVCGETDGEALGHTAGEIVVENNVAPDCVNDGSYDNVVYCTVCNEELSRDTVTVAALGHTEGETVVENNVAPDCVNAGSYDNVVYCAVCNEELSRDTITVDALGHSYNAVVTDPTCTENGYTTYTCNCGHSYTDNTVAALGHKYNDYGLCNNSKGCPALSGWNCIDEAWYYFYGNGERAEGITRVPYPTEAINGVNYAPNEKDVEYAESKGQNFIDATEAWFVFGEDGKFSYSENGHVTHILKDEESKDVTYNRYAVNGMIPWHVGLTDMPSTSVDGEDYIDYYYYFIGDTVNGGNIMATGDVYVTRANGYDGFVEGGVYTFYENGALCKYDGVTRVNGTLRYYEDAQLILGAGLVKIEVNDEIKYIYVRYNGEIVANDEYYLMVDDLEGVGLKETLNAASYYFDKNGYMIVNDGIVDGYYYENGTIAYGKGLIKVEIEGETKCIYVRSNGQLATGTYYVTNVSNYTGSDVKANDKFVFDENGFMLPVKNGIVEEDSILYYYENGSIAYNKGIINIDGNYYYVRSNGQIVVGRDYWTTNVGDSELVEKSYTFDANGVMQNPEFVADQKNGIVDGYYYVDGHIAYGAGLIAYNGGYIYVRSSGQVVVGRKYEVTVPNTEVTGYEAGIYEFDENGMLIVE